MRFFASGDRRGDRHIKKPAIQPDYADASCNLASATFQAYRRRDRPLPGGLARSRITPAQYNVAFCEKAERQAADHTKTLGAAEKRMPAQIWEALFLKRGVRKTRSLTGCPPDRAGKYSCAKQFGVAFANLFGSSQKWIGSASAAEQANRLSGGIGQLFCVLAAAYGGNGCLTDAIQTLNAHCSLPMPRIIRP
jgi:hypothetical protein